MRKIKQFYSIGFWIPAILILVSVIIFPFVYLFYMSFTDLSFLVMHPPRFVGIQNYLDALTSLRFWNALKVTLIFTGVTVSIQLVLGLGIAMLLDALDSNVVRSLIILPIALTPVVVGLLWRFMYIREFGVLNYLLSLLKIAPRAWLGEPSVALLAVMIMDIWQWTPFVSIILLAGLRGIPSEPYEAAKIDGASSAQIFWYITLPLLKSAIFIVAILRIVDSFRIFDTIWVTTAGGPGTQTETLSILIYKTAFKFFNIGSGSALSFLFLVLLLAISILLFKISKIKIV